MSKRIKQINGEIQRYLSEIITYDLKNPAIAGGIISVVKVDTTNDLSLSKIYLSVFNKQQEEEVLNQIKHSATYIRKELAQKLDIRKVPYLEFYIDKSAQYKSEIDTLLEKIKEEK